MLELFIRYFAVLIASIVILYGIGFITLGLAGIHPTKVFTSLFIKLFIGIISFTAICALYFTSLKTIFLGLVISCIYLVIGFWQRIEFNKGGRTNPNFRKEIRALLLFTAVTALIFCCRFYSASYNGNQILNIPNSDFTFYARISNYLTESGIESATPTLVYPESNSIDPYHYFDSWFNGGVSYFAGGDNLQILYLISYSLGISITSFGCCALVESFNRKNIFNISICFLATFILPVQSQFSDAINKGLSKIFLLIHAPPDYLSYGLWNMPKVYPVYLVLIVTIIALQKKEKYLAIAAASTLPFIYTTISIPTIGTLFLYLFCDYYFVSRDKKFFLVTLIYLLTSCCFIFIFYEPYITASEGTPLTPFYRFGTEPWYLSILRPPKIFFDATLQLVILFLPFLILIWIELKLTGSFKTFKMNWSNIVAQITQRPLLQFCGILYVCGLGSWAVLNGIIDSNQFFATTAIPMLNILCFIIVIHLTQPYLRLLAGLLLLYCMAITAQDIFEERLHSEEYMAKIERLTKENNKISGFLLTETDLAAGYGDNVVDVLGDYVTLFRPDSYMVNLSTKYASTIDGGIKQEMLRPDLQPDFYKFVELQKKNKTFSSVVQSRIDFIDRYNIDYIIVSSHVTLDSLIEERVTQKIKDAYSGDVFIMLNRDIN